MSWKTHMQKITPFLWFDTQAEEAMNFYVSIFKNSKVGTVSRNDEDGKAFVVTFELDGLEFYGLNGGPMYKFSPATSMFVSCETQAEVDHFWEKLSEGGEPNQCGWVTDKFGVTWQIVPNVLGQLMGDPDREKAGRVFKAMLGMVKLDIGGLLKAYAGD
jgi:predicted 3-demethylubiquinone-9 3-methyltransferase (glyoxalase superfamily)